MSVEKGQKVKKEPEDGVLLSFGKVGSREDGAAFSSSPVLSGVVSQVLQSLRTA